jgi:hypothetical protein
LPDWRAEPSIYSLAVNTNRAKPSLVVAVSVALTGAGAGAAATAGAASAKK